MRNRHHIGWDGKRKEEEEEKGKCFTCDKRLYESFQVDPPRFKRHPSISSIITHLGSKSNVSIRETDPPLSDSPIRSIIVD
jgi:hypothetical protein